MGKYALTEQERKWLKQRDRNLFSFGLYLAFTPGMSPALIDYRDAAEFEARVSRCIAENASELDMISNNLQFLDGFKAKSLAWYILREARIAVEEKMDNE